jgi:hypothetical protein
MLISSCVAYNQPFGLVLMLALSLLESFKLIRPHPNGCFKGDLDGDLCFITWDDFMK